jgi:hypothetical protein
LDWGARHLLDIDAWAHAIDDIALDVLRVHYHLRVGDFVVEDVTTTSGISLPSFFPKFTN